MVFAAGGVPPKGDLGENPFPPSERLLRKVKSKRKAKKKKTLWKTKNQKQPFLLRFLGFCYVEIFEVAIEKNFTATKWRQAKGIMPVA